MSTASHLKTAVCASEGPGGQYEGSYRKHPALTNNPKSLTPVLPVDGVSFNKQTAHNSSHSLTSRSGMAWNESEGERSGWCAPSYTMLTRLSALPPLFHQFSHVPSRQTLEALIEEERKRADRLAASSGHEYSIGVPHTRSSAPPAHHQQYPQRWNDETQASTPGRQVHNPQTFQGNPYKPPEYIQSRAGVTLREEDNYRSHPSQPSRQQHISFADRRTSIKIHIHSYTSQIHSPTALADMSTPTSISQ